MLKIFIICYFKFENYLEYHLQMKDIILYSLSQLKSDIFNILINKQKYNIKQMIFLMTNVSN